MTWYIYSLPPIDFWMGWTPFDVFVGQMAEEFSPWSEYEAREMLRTATLLLLLHTDWEMDRYNWRVTALPLDEPEPKFGRLCT